jgi:hypothetical protein
LEIRAARGGGTLQVPPAVKVGGQEDVVEGRNEHLPQLHNTPPPRHARHDRSLACSQRNAGGAAQMYNLDPYVNPVSPYGLKRHAAGACTKRGFKIQGGGVEGVEE